MYVAPGALIHPMVVIDAADAPGDALTGTIDWGDGTSTTDGTVLAGMLSGSHIYPQDGTYTA